MKNVKVLYRILIIVGVAIAGMATITAFDLVSLRDNLMADRRDKTQNLVDSAYTLVAHFGALEAAGSMTRAEAQAAAKQALKALRYDDDNYFWVNDHGPRMVMHPIKPELEGQDVSQFKDSSGKLYFQDFVAAAQDGAGFVEYSFPKPGSDAPAAKISYVKDYAPWGWIIGSGIYVDDVDEVFAGQAFKSGGFLLLAVLVAGGVSYMIARGITGPLAQMTAVMRALKDGRLEVEVPASDRKDEIGEMAKSIQVFKQNAVEMKRMEADQVRERERAEQEKRRTMLSLADQFESSVGAIAKAVAGASTELKASANSMSATVEETNTQARVVVSASDQASLNVQTVASASEELSSSIQEISRQVAESSTITSAAVDEADRTNAQVQGLAEAAQKIGEVVDLINEIASQTNLLALNATIEAARAGEAGKGFAVVASEVKTLASRTAKATEEITGQITAVQTATSGAVSAITGIGQTIGRINTISSAIAAAVEQQGAATQEIARNAEQASFGTREVTSNIKGVEAAAAETGRMAEEVLSASGDLSQQAEALSKEVACVLAGIRSSGDTNAADSSREGAAPVKMAA